MTAPSTPSSSTNPVSPTSAVPPSSSSTSHRPTLEPQLQKLILRQVFSHFIKASERKLSELDYDALDRERNLSLSILPGADADFDEKIVNLAQITSHCPKLMIDSIMIWRGQRRNQAAEMVASIQMSKYPNVSLTDLENRIKRRNSLMANFILCRVLIAIIQNLGTKPLNSELGKRLEDMVFGQLRSADPEQTARFVNLEANVKLFSQLMGTLSNTRFPTISDRFVSEVRNIQVSDKAAEGKLDLMIKCMHYLKLKIYPMNALEESADFLQAINDLFQDSASTRIKLSLCELYNDLLEPVAKVADAELNVPVWQKTIELIAPKVMKMLQKGKNLNIVLSLMATLLTVSKKEYFLKNWPSLIETLVSKFKERPLKLGALNSICKLLWTYLFRCFETPSSLVQKRIDYFSKVLFPVRKAVFPSECNLDVFVRIVYYVLVKFPEYGNETLISSLLTADVDARHSGENDSFSLGGRSETSIVLDEFPNADRLFIAFRAFILILRDVERSIGDKDSTTAGAVSAVQSKAGLVLVEGKINLTQPNFPCFDDASDYSFPSLSKIGSRDEQSTRKSYSDGEHPLNLPLTRDSQLRMGSSMRDTLKLVNTHVGQAFLTLDNIIGNNMITEPPAPAFVNPYITSQTGSGTFSKSQTASGSYKYSSGSTSGYKYMSASSTSSFNSINGSGRASAVVESLNSFTGIPNRQEIFSTVELLEGRPPETSHQVYTRLLRTIMDSLPRFYPSGISPVKVIEMLSRYAVLHYDVFVQHSAFESICRIAKVKRIDPDGSDWKIAVGNEMMSASVFKIFNEATLMAIRSHFSDLWLASDKFEDISVRLAERKLALLDIWLEDISTSTTFVPKQNEVDSIVELVESQGLFYICCMNANLRKTGIKILKMSQDFRSRLLEKMPKKNLEALKKGNRVGSDSFERLSIFQGGKRASLYQRSRDYAATETKPYISIYDIMVDQGERIVRENISETSLKGVQADSTADAQKKLKAYNANLMSMDNPLLHVAQSSSELDVALWNRCSTPFLKCLIDYASKECLKKTLIQVWGFLQVMQPILHTIAEEITVYRVGFLPTLKKFEKTKSTPSATTVDSFIDYWRLYASFSYVCFEIYQTANEPTSVMDAQAFNICTPGELNRNVLPLLSSGKHEVRKAALSAIGCIQINGYAPLLRDIQPYMAAVVSDSQTAIKRQTAIFENAFERMRTQLAHLLTYIANFTKVSSLRNQSNVMKTFHDYIRAMIVYFTDSEVQSEWKHQVTRFYFCSFVEKYYKFLLTELESDATDGFDNKVEMYIGFKSRKDLFSLFESWCGFGVDASKNRLRESNMIAAFLESNKDAPSSAINGKIEVHRRSIQIASLKAMAALCRGPLIYSSDSQQFMDVHRIIAWINGMLEASQSTFQSIAKTAIENVLESNVSNEYLITEILTNCYTHSGSSNLTTGYFLGLVNLMGRSKKLVGTPAKMATLSLFQLGSSNSVLRKGAGSLLFFVEKTLSSSTDTVDDKHNGDQFFDWYGVDDDDASAIDIDEDYTPADYGSGNASTEVEAVISASSVPAIYKKAQLEASKKLAKEHPELAMEVLNEVTLRVQSIKSNSDEDARKIKNLLLILNSWLCSFTLVGSFSVDRTHEFTSSEQLTWNILYNLFYLTARCSGSDIFANDIQELWTESVSVKSKEDLTYLSRQKLIKAKLFIISDFLAVNAFSLQSTRAVHVTKNIAIILATSEYGPCLVDHLVSKLTPKSIAPIADSVLLAIINHGKVASRGHTVDLSGATPASQNTSKLSLCYLYMLQLIDCSLVLDKYLFILHLPVLLHITITQLDASKCEEMRTLLVFLIQSILSSDKSKRKKVDPILKALSLKEGKSLWKNEDPTPENPEPESTGQMSALALEILDIFSLVHPQLQEDWAEVATKWGATCSDYHTACRSLQVLRALKPKVSHSVLAQLSQSLSAAVSDVRSSMQCHSLDLLLAINQIYQSLKPSDLLQQYSELFWISLSLLSSVHEWEYFEGLKLLKGILGNIDLSQKNVINSLMASIPSKWPGGFNGVLGPLSRGLASSTSSDLALDVINSLLFVSVPQFLDTRPSKMLFVALANLPKILQPYEYESGLNDLFDRGHSVIEASLLLAENIAAACSASGSESVAHLLITFTNQRIRKRDDFLRQMATIIKDEYRTVEGEVVKFCLFLLTNANFIYPNCFLSLLECLWQDQSLRMNSTALPADVSGAWLRPLISLLESPSLGFRAARLLDVMLSVRLRASEADITKNVGGAQNIYAYVKKAKSDAFVYKASGWHQEDAQSETAALTKKRVYTVAKSFHQAIPVDSAPVLGRKGSVVEGKRRDGERLLALFSEHESYFSNAAAQAL